MLRNMSRRRGVEGSGDFSRNPSSISISIESNSLSLEKKGEKKWKIGKGIVDQLARTSFEFTCDGKLAFRQHEGSFFLSVNPDRQQRRGRRSTFDPATWTIFLLADDYDDAHWRTGIQTRIFEEQGAETIGAMNPITRSSDTCCLGRHVNRVGKAGKASRSGGWAGCRMETVVEGRKVSKKADRGHVSGMGGYPHENIDT